MKLLSVYCTCSLLGYLCAVMQPDFSVCGMKVLALLTRNFPSHMVAMVSISSWVTCAKSLLF